MATNNLDLECLVEALLFLHGDNGINQEELSQIFVDEKPSAITKAMSSLNENYRKNNSALTIQRYNHHYYRLCLEPTISKHLSQLIPTLPSIKLSPSMIEVATIVAYRGPITRSEIDSFRGVDSSFLLNKLRDLNLVTSIGYKPETRAHLYQVTAEFFKVFNLAEGMKSLAPVNMEELPPNNDLPPTLADNNANLFNYDDELTY